MDPIAAVLCGIGAVLATGEAPHLGFVYWLLLAAAFVGVTRAARSRALPWLLGLVGVAFALSVVWGLLNPGFEFTTRHDTLFAAPSWLEGRTIRVAFLLAVIVARRRIGPGLAAVTITASSLGLLFGGLETLLDPKPESSNASYELALAAASGWTSVAHYLTAIAFLVVGFGAPTVSATPRRASAITGVVGALLIAVTWSTIQTSRSDGPQILSTLTGVAGWICVAVALGRTIGIGGGGSALAGMILVIVQILFYPFILSTFDHLRSDLDVALGMGFFIGLLGLALATMVSTVLPLQRARLGIGGLFLVASSGSAITLGRYLAQTRTAPFWAERTFAQPCGVLALVLWASYLAFLSGPPQPESAAG